MKPSRFKSKDFNPEQFLAKEKKAGSLPMLSIAEFLPLGFSKPFTQQFIARLLVEEPTAFYRGGDPKQIIAANAALFAAVGRELSLLQISADRQLVELLAMGVMASPLWKRTVRRQNAA